jgi:hypothetical protein
VVAGFVRGIGDQVVVTATGGGVYVGGTGGGGIVVAVVMAVQSGNGHQSMLVPAALSWGTCRGRILEDQVECC